ncbi:MAG: stage V sporulation protein AC [Ruminococcaceae bacterium]|nr:stage V sporulation protein AC [Oscillospiraceae bacterium]
MNKKEYSRYAEKRAKKSRLPLDCFNAFWVGGIICTIGQILKKFYLMLGASEENVKMLVPISLIFAAVLLSGMGIFDKIAKLAGAGTLVPITGFANAVVSPALDTKAEGWVLGVGAKIFTISGPVILYGILSGAVYGIIYWMVH